MWYLGIDVSRATLDGALWQDTTRVSTTRVANDPAGMDALAAWVAPHVAAAPLTLVLEPTGGYEAPLAFWAHARGWRVVRVNPAQARAWITSQGRRAKTDALDAQGLAAYGATHPQLPRWSPPPAHLSALNDLLQHHETLDRLLRQEQQRLDQARRKPQPTAPVIASHERVIQELQNERATVEQAIAEALDQAPDVAETRDQLATIAGIGATTSLYLALCFLLWHHDPARSRSEKAITAFVGLDPLPHESGTSVRKPRRISRMGQASLRARLYMAALSQTPANRTSRAHMVYQRLVERGKPKPVALVATMRKLLCWAWAVFQETHPPPLPTDA